MKKIDTSYLHLKTLKEATEYIVNHSLYAPLAEYARLKDLGLRKQALIILEQFVQKLQTESFEVRRDFVRFEARCSLSIPDFSDRYATYWASSKIIYPTLQEWMKIESESAEAYKWLGLNYSCYAKMQPLAGLELAYEKNPHDQEVLVDLLRWQIRELYYSTHHLSERKYLGDPNKDLKDAEGIYQRCHLVEDEEKRKSALEKLTYYRTIIQNWLLYLQTDQSLTFIKFFNSGDHGYTFGNCPGKSPF